MSTLHVGITGGIGSGKSLVCKIFQCLGVPVYDADRAAKRLMISDEILMAQIKKEFGEEAYDADGSLNRSFISKKTFGYPERLEKLNQFVHPRVANDYESWTKGHAEHPYVVKEAALLFEAGSAARLDKIIVVSAPVSLRIQRVLQRDTQRSEEEIKKIIASQMPEDEKVRRADFVVVNDEHQLLIPQVLELHRQFISRPH
jgi:dephospho-CoA kinase